MHCECDLIWRGHERVRALGRKRREILIRCDRVAGCGCGIRFGVASCADAPQTREKERKNVFAVSAAGDHPEKIVVELGLQFPLHVNEVLDATIVHKCV